MEAEVGAGGLEPLVEGAVVGGQLANSLLEGGVLGGDPLDGFLSPLGLQVPYLAEEFADAGALGEDLGLGGLECVLGVQRALAPRRLALVVLFGELPGPPFAGLGYRCGGGGPGLGVGIEEGA